MSLMPKICQNTLHGYTQCTCFCLWQVTNISLFHLDSHCFLWPSPTLTAIFLHGFPVLTSAREFVVSQFWPVTINLLTPELNPICYLLALLGAHHFLHVRRIRVKLLTFRLLMSSTYGEPILDISRSHTTTQHSR